MLAENVILHLFEENIEMMDYIEHILAYVDIPGNVRLWMISFVFHSGSCLLGGSMLQQIIEFVTLDFHRWVY